MKIVFIGDSHGKFEGFNALARYAIGKYGVDEIVSVGDFGAGWDWSSFKNELGIPVRFIDGNHEHHEKIKDDSYRDTHDVEYIPRGTIRDGVFYHGGATTHGKKPNGEYFEDENITMGDLYRAMDAYDAYVVDGGKIHLMVCHDTILPMYGLVNNHHGANDRNAKMLFNMFESIQPSAYVHGHHHVAKTYGFRDCEFRSLDMCGGRKVQEKIADDAQTWFNACCAVWDTETNSWV